MDRPDGLDRTSDLIHYGIKGMRWGVRKSEKPKAYTGEVVLRSPVKNGGELVVQKKVHADTSWLNRKLISPEKFDELSKSYPNFVLTNKAGEKVGEASFARYDNTLELEWIGVDKGHRRNGYARAALNGVIKYAQDEGITELNLVATKMGAPLYESLGFQRTNQGHHQLKIDSGGVRQSDLVGGIDIKKLARYISESIEQEDPENDEEVEMSSIDPASDLIHYGIKGMRWGVRRKRGEDGRVDASTSGRGLAPSDDAVKAATYKKVAKKSGVEALSNQELKQLVDRMNLEQQYSRLQGPSSSQKAAKVAGELIQQVGKQQVSSIANRFATKQVEKLMRAAGA